MEASPRQQATPLKNPFRLFRRYGVAVLVTGLTLLVSLALRQVLEDAVPLVLFILAALEEARTFRPGVVLLDIGLPKLDGYEVARRLCQEPGRDRRLLLAMTGYGQEEDRRRSREAGFDHHLVKPVDLDELRGLLDSWCHGMAAGRADSGG